MLHHHCCPVVDIGRVSVFHLVSVPCFPYLVFRTLFSVFVSGAAAAGGGGGGPPIDMEDAASHRCHAPPPDAAADGRGAGAESGGGHERGGVRRVVQKGNRQPLGNTMSHLSHLSHLSHFL